MLSDSPWQGLAVEGVDSRRVDHTGNWNFFWTILSSNDPALALVLKAQPISAPKMPQLRSLEAAIALLNGNSTFYIRLKDHRQLELFETLCLDVIGSTEKAETEAGALIQAIGRTYRWHHLLRGGRSNSLTVEQQKGLIGELTVLEWLSALIGPRAAITGWTGPMGSPKDFELNEHCIEVKARRSAAQPFVQISNEFQLADVDNHTLWLNVLAVDQVTEPFGNCLDFFVERAALCFKGEEADLLLLWETAISASGYRVEDNYSETRWLVGDQNWYEVRDQFPRVDLPLKVGVANLRYAIELAACAPFKAEVLDAAAAISVGYTDG